MMIVYEYYYDLRYFKMSGFYILVVRTETPKTLRGDVFTNHHQTKPLERFVVQRTI